MGMGKEQRDAIRRALNEDAGKLIEEGEPNDSQLRRLRREIDEVNALFEEFERLAAEGELVRRAWTDGRAAHWAVRSLCSVEPRCS